MFLPRRQTVSLTCNAALVSQDEGTLAVVICALCDVPSTIILLLLLLTHLKAYRKHDADQFKFVTSFNISAIARACDNAFISKATDKIVTHYVQRHPIILAVMSQNNITITEDRHTTTDITTLSALA